MWITCSARTSASDDKVMQNGAEFFAAMYHAATQQS
jgi:hypothetical protein